MLLRNPSTAKKNSVQQRKKRDREGPGKGAELRREAIPGRCPATKKALVLPNGGTGKGIVQMVLGIEAHYLRNCNKIKSPEKPQRMTQELPLNISITGEHVPYV